MENQMNGRNITLGDLWDILLERLWVIILAAAIAAGSLWAINSMVITPEYESTATLYILRQNGETDKADVSSDFSLALKVVNDCTYLLKSHSVLDALIEELELDLSYDDLYDSIQTHNPDDTRILEVTVTNVSPMEAKRIVDCLVNIGTSKINEAMGFEQVNLYEHGTMDMEPSNRLGVISCALAGMIVGVLVYCGFVVTFLMDDKIRKEEDIERYLGLSVLSDISNIDDSSKKKVYGYGQKRSSQSVQEEEE